MGILLVIGMMAYSAGLCWLFQRIDERSNRIPELENEWDDPLRGEVVPDHVPGHWVEAYRSEQGG